MKLASSDFELSYLHKHLQYAVDLELWTIPFYMSAMYSIKDRSCDAYQLIRSIVNQEMLHLQSAANIANALGYSPTISTPVYDGTTVPHLDFSKDPIEVTKQFMPYTAEIGPLDLQHINAMCLIELPEFDTHQNTLELFSECSEYGTIGAFYQALLFAIKLHKNQIRGGVRQVDYFAPFYRNAPDLIVSESKDAGLSQVELLIQLITEQGEGYTKLAQIIPPVFQNTADDPEPEQDHFKKFVSIKDAPLPEVFQLKDPGSYSQQDIELQAICEENFTALTLFLEGLFTGENPGQFFPCMAGVGGSIRNCWQNGVVPKFGDNSCTNNGNQG